MVEFYNFSLLIQRFKFFQIRLINKKKSTRNVLWFFLKAKDQQT